MQNISLVLMSVSLWLITGSVFAQQSKPNVSQSVSSAVTAQAVTHTSDQTGTRFVNNRTDNDLVATYGTCYLNDFRFFTMLHQDEWDLLRWETIGNAVMAHRTWRNWPYEQHLDVQVDGVSVLPGSMNVDEVEQQFDFRKITVSSPLVKIKRLDMMMSARQWITAIQVTNQKNISSKITIKFDWTEKNKSAIDIRPWSDKGSEGFTYSIVNGPPIIVSIGANGIWEKQGETGVSNVWELNLTAGETRTLDLNVHIGWTNIPEYKDQGPGVIASDQQATIDHIKDNLDEFKNVAENIFKQAS